MKKLAIFSVLLFSIVTVGISTASAHVEVQLRGYSSTAGDESMIWLRAEHGCMYNNGMYPTEQLQVTVPNAAGRPIPSNLPGFVATVVDSKKKDSAGVPSTYTVTWKAKNAASALDGSNYFEVGMITTWSKKPQTFYIPAIQTCLVNANPTGAMAGMGGMSGTKDLGKPLFLKWIVTTGAVPKDTSDTEYGPAAKFTITK